MRVLTQFPSVMLTVMDAGDLLGGPRGRRLCYEFIQRSVARSAGGRIEVDSQAAVEAVAEACTWAMYWQPPDRGEDDLQSSEWLTRLPDVAEAVASSPATIWWSGPLALDDQHLVRFLDADAPEREHEPTLTGLRAAVDGLSREHSREFPDDAADVPADQKSADGAWSAVPGVDPESGGVGWQMVSGVWWSAPIAQPGAHTARSIGQPPFPAGLTFVEDSLGWTAATSWQVAPIRDVKILELDGPEDWVELVRRYPLDVTATTKRGDWWRTTGRDGSWAMPDWPAVAEDWDAVHLSVTGYLTSAGRALPMDSDTATVLAGWPPDATFWLADVLRVAGPPTLWRRDRDSNVWTPA